MKIRNFTDIKSFFLENKTLKQTIFKNTFWLVVAEGVSRLLELILLIYLARILGATEYGKFIFVLAFINLFFIFTDFGISQITTREFSQNREKEKEFSNLLSLKLLLCLGTLFLILIGSFFITPDYLIRKVIWIFAAFSVIEGFLLIIFAFFQAKQKMEYQAGTKIFGTTVVTAIGFFIIFNFPSVENLSYGYLFGSLVTLIFVLIFFHFKIFRLALSWNKTIWQKFLALSWPLALATAFVSIYTQIDSVMMGYLKQITQIGWYNAAYKIIGGFFILAGLISMSFFPALSKFFKESKEKLQKIWNYFMELMIFLAIPIVIGGITLAPRIIDFIYDPSFFPSGRETILAFQILIIMTGVAFLSNPFNQILIAANQQKKLLWATFSGSAVNVILNLILIPKYSLYGAAATILVTHLLIFFLVFRFTLKFTPIRPLNLEFFFNFLSAILAVIPMYFVIIQPTIYHLNVILSVLIGTAIYLICFLMYKNLLNKLFISRVQIL